MSNKMLIDATHPEETRVVVLRGNRVEEFDFESASRKQLRGNIYLAKVTRVEPSLQAAFVDYGGNRHGFLAFSEIHPDYYQIPVADRQALLDDERRAHEDESNGEQRRRGGGRRGGRNRTRGAGRNRNREVREERRRRLPRGRATRSNNRRASSGIRTRLCRTSMKSAATRPLKKRLVRTSALYRRPARCRRTSRRPPEAPETDVVVAQAESGAEPEVVAAAPTELSRPGRIHRRIAAAGSGRAFGDRRELGD